MASLTDVSSDIRSDCVACLEAVVETAFVTDVVVLQIDQRHLWVSEAEAVPLRVRLDHLVLRHPVALAS